jgi:hypothetical protein
MRFLHRLRQAVADRRLRSRLRREREKIRVLLIQDIDEDVKRAAVEQVKRKQEQALEDYVERS